MLSLITEFSYIKLVSCSQQSGQSDGRKIQCIKVAEYTD